jgi:ribosomal protein S27AE
MVSVVEKPVFFRNGWYCPKCGCMTEHKKVKGRQVCLECGFAGPKYGQRPDVKAKKREYGQRPDVKAKQREYFQRPEVKAKQREYGQRPDVKAKKREYGQRPDVKAKKREISRRYLQRKKAKLEKLLENSKTEA